MFHNISRSGERLSRLRTHTRQYQFKGKAKKGSEFDLLLRKNLQGRNVSNELWSKKGLILFPFGIIGQEARSLPEINLALQPLPIGTCSAARLISFFTSFSNSQSLRTESVPRILIRQQKERVWPDFFSFSLIQKKIPV